MIYTVTKIEEDTDYGCEERSADQPVMAVVTLKDPEGAEARHRFPDEKLYQADINEGDSVIFDDSGMIRKPLDKDWTTYCTRENTDVSGFVEWMRTAQDGGNAERVCPFCGGKTGVISNENGRTVIGCESCDMRIELDVSSK